MSKKHHADRLLPSTPEHIKLPITVKDKVRELTLFYRKTKHAELLFPVAMKMDVMRFKQLLDRYMKNDFRYKQSEIDSTKTIAEWSLHVNAALRNQPSPKVGEWAI